ncbi:hypothetical protein DLR72_05995 [Vibrio paracholerae]|uniref:DUF3265 domain-containing protein n=1 Tax=Vibrio paracholerae TaxID=650003 RepID=A0ABD7FXI8_9VIBR|nr:hypothetical protein DLR72_05995 [Vibrio paracholerae]
MTLLSRGSPSQLTLLVNTIVHTYRRPITLLVVGLFFIRHILHSILAFVDKPRRVSKLISLHSRYLVQSS